VWAPFYVPWVVLGKSDEFCIEIRRESNPRGPNLHLIRSSTLTTRPTVYKRLEPNVPITCDRNIVPITCDRNIRFQSFIHGFDQPCINDWNRVFLSHVIGTFGSNRLYTVGRVVNVPITCDRNIRFQSFKHGWSSG